MPIFQYRCGKAHVTEILIGINDRRPNIVSCETCKRPARRQACFTTNMLIPAYMSATRSQASERQGAYLTSEKHMERRRKDDAAAERRERTQASLDSHLQRELGGDRGEEKVRKRELEIKAEQQKASKIRVSGASP